MMNYFVAAMTCPVCGAVSPETEVTDMVNRLPHEQGPMGWHRVGDALEVTADDLAHLYFRIREPRPDEPLVILDDWLCQACGSQNWALVVLADGVIRSIDAVTLIQDTVDSAHFVTRRIRDLFPDADGDEVERLKALVRG